MASKSIEKQKNKARQSNEGILTKTRLEKKLGNVQGKPLSCAILWLSLASIPKPRSVRINFCAGQGHFCYQGRETVN